MDLEKYKHNIKIIDWNKYDTAYGGASKIPFELCRLVSDNNEEVMDATHRIWCSLCHQHAYISSATEPAYPFLKQVLIEAKGDLLVELLDIFAGFAECSSPKHPKGKEALQKRVWALLEKDITLFRRLAETEGTGGYAEFIVKELMENA